MGFATWMMSLVAEVVVVTALTQKQSTAPRSESVQGNILRPGLHICRQDAVVMQPVPTTKAVCVPYYQRSYLPCRGNKTGVCPHIRLSYRVEMRRMIEMRPHYNTRFSCCPGWAGYDAQENACLEPVCIPACQHGGKCHVPNTCNCDEGWSGSSCQSDVDECQSKPCEQRCVNSDGSYHCECHHGYHLSGDGRTCTFCLSCTDEFTTMLQDQKHLTQTVNIIHVDNDILTLNVTKLHKDLRTLSTFPTSQPTQELPRPPSSATPSPEQQVPDAAKINTYLSSLSEQIAMLEERLDVCTCTKQSRQMTAMPGPRARSKPRHG
ncbi:epidermal growth factor-like protein 7 isoform X1 [Haliotis cracherodii]|uniref:epidermal growth factor-like protein 7 isoform X1 n=2 Tax=Haliotis cracherodii TaxID=6455 RepID=UPI0039E95534